MHTEQHVVDALERAGLSAHIPALLRLRLTPSQWLRERPARELEEECLDAWTLGGDELEPLPPMPPSQPRLKRGVIRLEKLH